MNPLHYPSLELCKKLTEIGFPKTSYVWGEKNGSADFASRTIEIELNRKYPSGLTFFVCPSVMEMLDVMPADIHVGHHQYTWSITPYGFTYAPNQSHGTDKIPFFATDDMESISIDPNALAEMILYLHENGFVDFKKSI